MQRPRRESPEEKYLQKKREELAALESQLADRELELHTLRGGLLSFEKQYETLVSAKYAQLDEINVQIAERLPPPSQVAEEKSRSDGKAKSPASRPRPRRIPPNERRKPAAPIAPVAEKPPDFNPAESLKRLYRDVAKSIHPDLADSEIDRAHRHAFMIRANQAYEAGDEATLLAVFQEWEQAPESVKGDGPGADLVRVIRKIAWCEQRLVAITEEVQEILTSGLFGLKEMVEEAAKFQRDLLAEMTQRIDADLAEATQRLAELGGPIERSEQLTPSPLEGEGGGEGGAGGI
jgi:hypothetical protein